MPTERTGERPLPGPPRAPARRAVALVAALAACAPLVQACGADNENENTIAPIRARLAVDPAPPDDPAVFFREHIDPDDPSSADDLVFIDVVLRSASPLVFDAFTLEVHFDPGLVHVAGGSLSGAFLDTPFGVCNETEPNPLICTAQDPICIFSADDPNATGILLLGVAANTGSGCPAATANGEVNLLTLGFAAAAVGTSSIDLIDNSGPMTHGDCEILMTVGGVPTDLDIPCDGNATVSATR